MIKIECPAELETALKISEDIGEECFDSLIRGLAHLHHFFEKSGATVELYRDFGERGPCVENFAWSAKRKNGDAFYHGGLNFSRYDNTWSLNS